MLKKLLKNNFKKVVVLDKKEGETPLEALSLFRNKHKEYKDVSMTYAGRLDPMASGVLVLLCGEEVKNKEKYLAQDKEYEFEILFGFATDTYDILGKATASPNFHRSDLKSVRQGLAERELKEKINESLKFFRGKIIQKYPVYSSKTLNGKQLWQYGREGKEVERPQREVAVKSLKFLGLKNIKKEKLAKDIEKRISKVNGDFRQKEIIKIWGKVLADEKLPKQFFVGSFKIKCSSGTYIRVISSDLGEKIGIPSLAYKIKRTKVGRYAI